MPRRLLPREYVDCCNECRYCLHRFRDKNYIVMQHLCTYLCSGIELEEICTIPAWCKLEVEGEHTDVAREFEADAKAWRDIARAGSRVASESYGLLCRLYDAATATGQDAAGDLARVLAEVDEYLVLRVKEGER